MTTTKLRSRIAASISAVPPICASAPTTMKPAAAGAIVGARDPGRQPQADEEQNRERQAEQKAHLRRAERAERPGQFALHDVARRLGGRGGRA